MDKEQYILELVNKGYSDEDIIILVNAKFPEPIPAPDPAATTTINPQDFLDRMIAVSNKLDDKIIQNESDHGVTNITDLTTGDAIYAKVEVGRIYFMAVDHNKQYLMQGLCITKNATQATFVGYSWNTSVKHTNTVWATANKGSTSGDALSFNGVSVDDLKNDDNAIANVALVKSLVSAGGGSGGGIPTGTFTHNSDKLISNSVGVENEEASIGEGYLGSQSYGAGSKSIIIGNGSENVMIGGIREIDGNYNATYIGIVSSDSGSIGYYTGTGVEGDRATIKNIVDIANIDNWSHELINKIKSKLGLSVTQTLQEYIDSLDWTNVNLSIPLQNINSPITYDMLTGTPSMDSNITVAITDHETIERPGSYSFVLSFSGSGETAEKTISVNITLTTPTNSLQDEIDALTWTGITYTTDTPIAENTLSYFDLIDAPSIPSEVTIDSISHPAIDASGNLDVVINFSGSGETYTKTISVAVTIGTQQERVITITNTQYTAIDESYKDTYGYALTGYTLTDTTTQFTKLILDVKENLTIPKTTKFYDDGYSNTIFVLNSIQSDTFNLVAGHKYSFEDTKDPVDLGTY